MLKRFKKGGIHPDPDKQRTSGIPLRYIKQPASLTILLGQNIGASSKPVVKVGDTVKRGDLIAEAGGFVGASIHAPLSGTVRKIERVRDLSGYWKDAILIETFQENEKTEFYIEMSEQEFAAGLMEKAPQEIVARIADAGVVGLGGAAFPTRVKLTIPDGKRIDYLLLNGAECEPYLTCDDRLMRDRGEDILRGALLMAKACGARMILCGIESNKPEALERMRMAAERLRPLAAELNRTIEVFALRTRYPQGSEKQLIQALTNRVVPVSGLPSDVGCVVDNVATAFACYQAVMFARPLTHRIVTVTGPDIINPGNYVVPNGTSYQHLIEEAGGLNEDAGKLISGGPMMGKAMASADTPVVKSAGGLLVLPSSMSHRRAERTCIRCGRCVSACPMGLEPYLLMTYSEMHLQQDAELSGVMSCLECGTCSYICPSYRPLLDAIRLSKSIIRKNHKR